MDNLVRFSLIINSNTTNLGNSGLKDFLVYQHYRDLEDVQKGKSATRINKYIELFNSFFEDKEFIGIENLEPLFRVKDSNEIFSVDELSSGEKQIFFRAGAILRYNLYNSIILIDEPEISLHPEWQQKILDFYKKVAGNNQLIISTHSPHIVSSCKKDEVRVLIKDNYRVSVKEYNEGTYGRTIEQLLFSVFGLTSVRDKEVQKKIDEFRALYINRNKLSDDERAYMKKLKAQLSEYLDPNDPEISLLDIEENTRKLKELLETIEENNNA